MMKLLIILTALCALAVGCAQLTRAQETALKTGGGAAAPFFGLPPAAGTALVDIGLAIAAFFAGHKNGRRVEGKKAKA